jgi:hypothetical protein
MKKPRLRRQRGFALALARSKCAGWAQLAVHDAAVLDGGQGFGTHGLAAHGRAGGQLIGTQLQLVAFGHGHAVVLAGILQFASTCARVRVLWLSTTGGQPCSPRGADIPAAWLPSAVRARAAAMLRV